jgi:HAD superfamily hydrolase (TIGR01509 family)
MAALAAALFDWDGTLIDSFDALLTAWRESTEQVLGRPYPDNQAERDIVFTLPGAKIWPDLARDDEELAALADTFQESYNRNAHKVRAFDGVPELLADLRAAGVRVAVVTSKSQRRFGPDAERAGIRDSIDVAVCNEDVAAPKPDPAPVLCALERLNLPAERTVMVGDTPVDVAAGLAAGTPVVGVTWGHYGEAELREAGAVAVVDSPHELLDIALDGVAA